MRGSRHHQETIGRLVDSRSRQYNTPPGWGALPILAPGAENVKLTQKELKWHSRDTLHNVHTAHAGVRGRTAPGGEWTAKAGAYIYIYVCVYLSHDYSPVAWMKNLKYIQLDLLVNTLS